jgi:ABC-type phosphate transport system substrate-binding protein
VKTAVLSLLAACIAVAAGEARADGRPEVAAAPCGTEQPVSGTLSSVGDGRMSRLMDDWLAGFQACQSAIRRGRWEHSSDATVIGTLMFELADMAPLARELTPAELAPYRHQFKGDMMDSPLLVRVATLGSGPAYVAVNRRPGAPLPRTVAEFLRYALSREGQAIAAGQEVFMALSAGQVRDARARLDGYLPELDPALPVYRPAPGVTGSIRSVGSDGMKSLMDRWMQDFSRIAPGVAPGSRWEHFGTLNGFYALLVGATDIAPMGRELWPSEAAAWESVQGTAAPFEVRVARGGFNTPQRTTAQAIFVHADNPLPNITIGQLAAMFGSRRTITRWGQLGLTGTWANRPIHLYAPPLVAPNATSMRLMILEGGEWSGDVRQGSIEETAAAIAADPDAIGFGGFEEGGPGLRTLAVARDEDGPFVSGTGPSVSSGQYPLTRYMYIRLNRPPGTSIPASVREFLRYVLSRDGQEPVRYSGYFPLTAAEVQAELARLD